MNLAGWAVLIAVLCAGAGHAAAAALDHHERSRPAPQLSSARRIPAACLRTVAVSSARR